MRTIEQDGGRLIDILTADSPTPEGMKTFILLSHAGERPVWISPEVVEEVCKALWETAKELLPKRPERARSFLWEHEAW